MVGTRPLAACRPACLPATGSKPPPPGALSPPAFPASQVGVFWVNKIYYLIIAGAGALLFSIYLIYDMQLIMGGRSERPGRPGLAGCLAGWPGLAACLPGCVDCMAGWPGSVPLPAASARPRRPGALTARRAPPPPSPPRAGVELSPDEYIFASLTLYIDIVSIFLYLLQVVGISRDL
jgi:FtsH-binding integral membrane protein